MLLHRFRTQLITLARYHHRPFGHHHILLRQASGNVEPLLDQQNGKPALIFESNDHVFDLIHDRRLNAFSRLIEQEQLWIQLQPARFAFLGQLSGHRNKKLLLLHEELSVDLWSCCKRRCLQDYPQDRKQCNEGFLVGRHELTWA